MQIRQLKVRDRKLVTELFIKGIKELKDESIENLIQPDAPASKADTEEQVGQAIVNIGVNLLVKVIHVVNTDVSARFADLAGVTPEEFDDLPMDTEIRILQAIKEAPEAEAFFTLAWLNAKGTYAFREMLSKGSAKLNSILESATGSSTSSDTEK